MNPDLHHGLLAFPIRKFVHRVTGRKIEVAPKPRYRHAVTHWKSVNASAFELSRRRDGRCRVGFPWGLLAV
jgi:hypothetical protein